MQKRTALIVVPVIVVFSFLIGLQAGRSTATGSVDATNPGLTSFVAANMNQERADMSLFWDVWDRVKNQYVDVNMVDPQKMIYGAIKGMVASLDDPYTVFMDPAESKEFKNNLTGKLDGIGAQLTVKDGALTMMSILRDSPAEKAALKVVM